MQKFLFVLMVILSGCKSYYLQREQVASEKANLYYAKKDYEKSYLYSKVAWQLNKSPKNLILLFQTADKLSKKKEALFYLKKLLEKDSTNTRFLNDYARLNKETGNLNQAKLYYQKLAQKAQSDKEYYLKQSSFIDSIKISKSKRLNIKALSLIQINTSFDESSPFLLKDTLFLSTNREGVMVKAGTYIDGSSPYKIITLPIDTNKFLSKGKIKDFTLPDLFKEYVNMNFISFTRNSDKFYFSATSHIKGSAEDSAYRIKMYVSDRDSNGSWKKPRTFIMNNKFYSYAHPFVEADDKMFFFSSDMAGGYGGTDIWVCINIDNKWTDPINLGPVVNTPGNEIMPFYHPDGSLYFSSDYHPGFGGFDFFKASETEGEWTQVVNMGVPYNSSADEAGIFINNRKNTIIFSSKRDGGKGGFDLYLVKKQ